MDLSKLSDQDLMAMRSGDLSQLSDDALMQLRGASAPGNAPAIEPGPHDFSTLNMVKNIPSSAASTVGDLFSAIRHPIDTAKGIGKLGAGVIDKGAEELIQALPEGVVGGVNKANNWLADIGVPLTRLPEENPKDITFDDTETADLLIEALKGRYGSFDNAQRTLENDPVGATVDLAALLSGVGGVAKIPGLAKAGAAVDPINAALGAGKYVLGKAIPKKLPSNMYQRSAKFSTTLSQADKQKLIDTALEYGISPTFKGAAKLQTKIDALNASVDSIISKATKSGNPIPKKALFQHFKELRKEKGGPLIEGGSDLKFINKVAKEYDTHLKAIKSDTISVKDMQKIKQDVYRKINFDAKHLRGTPIKEDTFKAIGRGAKDSIEKSAPGIKAKNKELSDLYNLQPNLQRAANRIEQNNLVPINAPLNVLAGSTQGPGGVAVGVIASLLENSKLRAAIAQGAHNLQGHKLADLMKNSQGVSQARLAAILAGRQDATNSNQ